MKKYKLIQEYPGSFKLNEIVVKTNNSYYKSENHPGLLISSNIENNPKFWEEVIEKDYEIVDLIGKNSTKPLRIFNPNTGLFKHATCNNVAECELDCLLDGGYSIHSIKRLSDGEIFTIGDFVECNSSWKNCKIVKFEILNDKLFITIDQEGSKGNYDIKSWGCFKHIKQPLFKTEDGVDIFEGDKYSWVNYLLTPGYNITAHPNHSCKEGMKFFSTKEKAEEYILMNKPCLSYNDIWNMGSWKETDVTETRLISKNKLKELVKSKL